MNRTISVPEAATKLQYEAQRIRFDDPPIWARIPREVLLHRMQTAGTVKDKVFAACLLWGPCGLQRCDYVCLKDDKGYFVGHKATKNANKSPWPIPAKLTDLVQLLGFDPLRRSDVWRALGQLEEEGAIRWEDGRIYPIERPVAPPPPPPKPPGYRRFRIGRQLLSNDTYQHLSEEERSEMDKWCEENELLCQSQLNAVLDTFDQLRKDQLSRHHIIIEKEKKRRREDIDPAAAKNGIPLEPPPPEQPSPPPEPEKPEPEPEPAPDPVAIAVTPALPVEDVSVEEDEDPGPVPPETDVEYLARHIPKCDAAAAQLLLNYVRALLPDATREEILDACQQKYEQNAGRIKNLIGFLLTVVPPMAAGPEWLEIRDKLKREKARGRRNSRSQPLRESGQRFEPPMSDEDAIREARLILENPGSSAREKEIAQELLEILAPTKPAPD